MLHPDWWSEESENGALALVCCQTPSHSNAYEQSATISDVVTDYWPHGVRKVPVAGVF